MDSKHEVLKRRVENCYKAIKTVDEELKKIRETECKHPETEKVDYQWAPGHIMSDTEVCSICGEVIKTYIGIIRTSDSVDSADIC